MKVPVAHRGESGGLEMSACQIKRKTGKKRKAEYEESVLVTSLLKGASQMVNAHQSHAQQRDKNKQTSASKKSEQKKPKACYKDEESPLQAHLREPSKSQQSAVEQG